MRSLIHSFSLSFALILPTVSIADENPVIEAMIEYLDFTEYQGGNLLPEQIPASEYKNFHIIDTRRAEDFAKDHIPGAFNIEWRQLVSRLDEIPSDKTVLVYCNTGSLSAQGAFALKLAGLENVKVLTGGFNSWKAKGGLEAYARASNPRF